MPQKHFNSARYILFLLLSVNLLNYIDRQALYAVFPLIKADLNLSDKMLGMLGSAFMISYMIAAPICGRLGDRIDRVKIASIGLFIWSTATTASAFTTTFKSLASARAAVGIGEASFGAVSPAIIAESAPEDRRGRILSIFFIAIPVGSALGYIIGGYLGAKYGWQTAFFVAGIPGFLMIFPLMRLKELKSSSKIAKEKIDFFQDIREIIKSRRYIFTTASMTAMTFAIGGLAQWIPTFFNRVHQIELAKANSSFGLITVVTGIIGTLSGGWIGDIAEKKWKNGYLYISAISFIAASIFIFFAIREDNSTLSLLLTAAAEFFIFFTTSPLNTTIVNNLPEASRSFGFAINIFIIHLLGDAISPAIIGWLSDTHGLADALLITPVAVLLASCFAFEGGRR